MPEIGLVTQCNEECPIGFWCRQIGIPGLGGLCCPLNSNSETSSKIGIGIAQISQQHLGKCPTRTIYSDEINCSAECREDRDCGTKEKKCCFNGCSTSCVIAVQVAGF